MDEQLPVIIFCCLMSKNKDLKFVINYLLHYFEKDDYHEPEKRIIAALNVRNMFMIGFVRLYPFGVENRINMIIIRLIMKFNLLESMMDYFSKTVHKAYKASKKVITGRSSQA